MLSASYIILGKCKMIPWGCLKHPRCHLPSSLILLYWPPSLFSDKTCSFPVFRLLFLITYILLLLFHPTASCYCHGPASQISGVTPCNILISEDLELGATDETKPWDLAVSLDISLCNIPFHYPLTCQRTSRLFPFPGYCAQVGSELFWACVA